MHVILIYYYFLHYLPAWLFPYWSILPLTSPLQSPYLSFDTCSYIWQSPSPIIVSWSTPEARDCSSISEWYRSRLLLVFGLGITSRFLSFASCPSFTILTVPPRPGFSLKSKRKTGICLNAKFSTTIADSSLSLWPRSACPAIRASSSRKWKGNEACVKSKVLFLFVGQDHVDLVVAGLFRGLSATQDFQFDGGHYSKTPFFCGFWKCLKQKSCEFLEAHLFVAGWCLVDCLFN
jgi:hypothetical protein